MSKVAVVYWSGTGNTEQMANAVMEGAASAGAEAELIRAADFSQDLAAAFDGIAFGCPSMGAEVLEESEFEPMFATVENSLAGKKVALFGSWGWGGGVWMEDWTARCEADGISLACDSVTCQEAPDDDALEQCRALGAAVAG